MYRPVGDLLGEHLLRLRLAGEGDEFLRQRLVRRALHHRPVLRIVETAGPDDGQFHPLLLRSGDAPVVGRAHHHVAGRQPLRRLGAGLPPLDVRLELVELGEGAADPLRGGKYLVEVLRLHPVGQQRHFQGVLGALAQATLAGELADVPEIRPGLRRPGQLRRVVGHHHRPDVGGHPALAESAGDELRGVAETRRVEAFEQPLVAAAEQFGALHLDHVPADLADVDHGLHLGHFAVVFAGDHLPAAASLEWLEIGLFLGGLGRAAEGDHRQALALRLGRRGERQAEQGQPGKHVCVLVQGLEHGTLPQPIGIVVMLLRQLPARGRNGSARGRQAPHRRYGGTLRVAGDPAEAGPPGRVRARRSRARCDPPRYGSCRSVRRSRHARPPAPGP